ncbi:MAG: hypothetical protein ACOX26_03665 [Bacilli bacterium]|jgi:hypothetical protein
MLKIIRSSRDGERLKELAKIKPIKALHDGRRYLLTKIKHSKHMLVLVVLLPRQQLQILN